MRLEAYISNKDENIVIGECSERIYITNVKDNFCISYLWDKIIIGARNSVVLEILETPNFIYITKFYEESEKFLSVSEQSIVIIKDEQHEIKVTASDEWKLSTNKLVWNIGRGICKIKRIDDTIIISVDSINFDEEDRSASFSVIMGSVVLQITLIQKGTDELYLADCYGYILQDIENNFLQSIEDGNN